MALEKFKARRNGGEPHVTAPQTDSVPVRDTAGVMIRLTREQRQRLKRLAVEERTSIQALGIQAFSHLFEEKGLPPL